MHASRSLRHLALMLVVCLVASCGGGDDSNGDTTDLPPTASVRLASTVPVTAVVTLDGSGSSASGGRTATYAWVLTSKPAGSTATLSDPTVASPTLTPDLVGTYAVTLSVNDGIRTTTVAGSTSATAYTPPTILSDLVEPVSGSVALSLSADTGASTITWTADGTAINTGATVTWDTTAAATSSRVVNARLQFAANYTIDVKRTFQVAQSPVAFNGATVTQSGATFRAITGAQSANGIVSVAATLDGAPLGTLAAPNGCLDATGAACATTGSNGYAFGGTAATGAHVVVITATDGIGRSLGIQLRFTVS